MSAVLAFIGGFWVLPDAPFFLPEGLDRTGLQLIFMNGWENIRVCDYADLSFVLVALPWYSSGWGGSGHWLRPSMTGDEKVAAIHERP